MVGKVEILNKRLKEVSDDKQAALLEEKKYLLNKIKSQCRVYYKKTAYRTFIEAQVNRLTEIEDNLNPDYYFKTPTPNDYKMHQRIEQDRRKIHQENTKKLAVKGISFLGMLIQSLPSILLLTGATAWCPPAAFVFAVMSLVLVTTVAVLYLQNELASKEKEEPKPLTRSKSAIFFPEEKKQPLSRPRSHSAPQLMPAYSRS
jgi:hypothetical protein